MKLWFANDVFNASPAQQRRLERELKKSYGNAYCMGYFIPGAHLGIYGKSFCVILDESKL